MQIRAFQRGDEAAVVALWVACDLVRPWNDPSKDIARKLGEHPELFLVGTLDGEIVASVMAGYEGHRGWLNYLAVAPAFRSRAYGRQIVGEAERLLTALGCPKVNLQVRASNEAVTAFYASLGYGCDEVVSLGKRLIPD